MRFALLLFACVLASCGARTPIGLANDAAASPDAADAGPDVAEDGLLPDVTPMRSGCLLYGGFASPEESSRGDTWTFDGVTWTNGPSLSPPGCSPGPGCGYIGSAVTVGGRVIFVGIPDVSGATVVDAFEWTGARWVNVAAKNPPSARYYPAVAAFGADVVLFGGVDLPAANYLGDTWILRDNAWSEVPLSSSPPPRSNAAVASLSSQLLLFGGSSTAGTLDDTWTWNGAAWNLVADPMKPSPRCGAAAAATSGGILLFGGCLSGGCTSGCAPGAATNETWEWLPDTHWSLLHFADSPPPRDDAMMGAEPVGTIYMFGGFTGAMNADTLSDTWLFNGSWTMLAPSPHPAGRGLAAMTCF